MEFSLLLTVIKNKKMKRGKLIVIDGSDSSGKRTQTLLLAERLKKAGKKVKTLSFPVYDSYFGKLVADYLTGKFGKLHQVSPKTASILYALDRYGQKGRINAWLKKGNIVVLDRYAESNMAYQAAKLKNKEKFLEWLHDLEYGKLGIPKADLVIYLHVPYEISEKLMEKRRKKKYLKGEKKDLHEKDGKYIRKVIANYLEFAKKHKNWHVVECVKNNKILSREEINDRIWRIIKNKI